MDIIKSKEKLKESVDKIRVKYPDKVPVFVTRGKSDRILKDIKQNKFLVPENITIGQFMFILRKKIDLGAEMAIFLFINNGILPAQTTTMENLYNNYKNKDGLLEIYYCGENTLKKNKILK